MYVKYETILSNQLNTVVNNPSISVALCQIILDDASPLLFKLRINVFG